MTMVSIARLKVKVEVSFWTLFKYTIVGVFCTCDVIICIFLFIENLHLPCKRKSNMNGAIKIEWNLKEFNDFCIVNWNAFALQIESCPLLIFHTVVSVVYRCILLVCLFICKVFVL